MNNYSDFDPDFLDEEDTAPFTSVTACQRELDTADSVVAQFAGYARALGYSVDPPRHWAERLAESLDRDMVEDPDLSLFPEAR